MAHHSSRPHSINADPDIRMSVKLGLDTFLGFIAWNAASMLLITHITPPLHQAVYALVCFVISLCLQTFRQHYRMLGFQDLARILIASALLFPAHLAALLAMGASSELVRLSFVAAVLTSGGWIGLRILARGWAEYRHQCQGEALIPTLIVGAGRAGVMVHQELLRHPELGSRVVGFIDDDLSKQGLRVHGTPVLGTKELIPDLVQKFAIARIILAIPSASGKHIRQIADIAKPLNIEIKTVPGVFNLLDGQGWKPTLKDISIDDLLRREPVVLDQSALQAEVEDQTVLITGAGGSIGSELARQISALRPRRLVLLGRGENSLWLIERELQRIRPSQLLALELCDIRNVQRLNQAFERWKPSIVFHAAAHKHVPILERQPEEAIENNVFGTQNVVEACLAHGVRRFVNISTDKAVNPTNILGVSKRIAELIVTDASRRAPASATYVSVRFGNVLGSRGSVIPIFQEQIASGGPVTVTHPDMTRYFMTIPEASRLVIQAGLRGETGQVYVLDMGEPVRISQLAEDMVRLHGFEPGMDVDITFTGTRPGEKLFEELFHEGAPTACNIHPKVMEAPIETHPSQSSNSMIENLRAIIDGPVGIRRERMIQTFTELVPTYKPAANGFARLKQD